MRSSSTATATANTPHARNKSDNNEDDDDDDEEDEEDYDPTKDQEAMQAEKEDEADEGLLTGSSSSQLLSHTKTSYPAVDQAFQELFGYPWGTVFVKQQQPPSSAATAAKRRRVTRLSATEQQEPQPHQETQQHSKNKILLTQLFGKEAAMKILHAPIVLSPSRLEPAPLPPLEVSLQQGKRMLTGERKRFAGVDMWVQSTVKAATQQQTQTHQQQQTTSISNEVVAKTSSVATTTTNTTTVPSIYPADATATMKNSVAATAAANSGTSSGLDAVLQELAGPSRLSTVAKTSADWDVFKTQQGAAAEVLEERAQGKDAFLVKKDFLSRVDVRRFEQEKAQRDLQRSSNSGKK